MYIHKSILETKDEVKNLLTIHGTSTKICGLIDISGDVEINCDVEGTINVDGKLTILKDSKISSDVTTKDCQIIGQYKGNMTASGKLTIMKGGIMNGNIITDRLIINEGGIFSGRVKRTDEVNNENTPIKESYLKYENMFTYESTDVKILKYFNDWAEDK